MRIGEAMQIRKKDLDLDHERIIINIPARFTKLKRTRVTFLSIEAGKAIKEKLEKISDDDLVYGTHDKVNVASNMERNYFVRCCKKQNLDSRTQKVCILKKKDLDKELKKLHNKMSAMLSKIEKLGNYNLDGVDISLGVSAGLLVFDVKGGVTLHYKHKK